MENVIARALILSKGIVLTVPLAQLSENRTSPSNDKILIFGAPEREIILHALREANGVIATAAVNQSRKRTTLNSKMRKLQISRSDLFSSLTP